MLSELENAAKVVGASQVRRALGTGAAKRIYLARNADPDITEPLEESAGAAGVPVVWADSMRALGKACGISVGASVAALV